MLEIITFIFHYFCPLSIAIKLNFYFEDSHAIYGCSAEETTSITELYEQRFVNSALALSSLKLSYKISHKIALCRASINHLHALKTYH